MLLADIFLLLISCAFLVLGAGISVRSITKIASYIGLSEFIVGFLLIAIATSIPELFVGVTSALNGTPTLSLGNVIGSNIVDLTLVIGVIALLGRGIKVRSEIARRDTFYMLILALFPILLMLDRELSRVDGCILLLAFFLYVLRLIGQRKEFRKKLDHVPRKDAVRALVSLCFGLLMLLVSARFIVIFASLVAVELFAPLVLIGLVIVSIGTTLPELVFESRAVLSGHKEMAVGDLLGSVVVNSTLVLGIVSLIYPITIVNFSTVLAAAGFMIVTVVIFTLFMSSGEGLSWQGGVASILLYIIFIIAIIEKGLL